MMAKYSILVSRSINVISRKYPWYSRIYISSLQFIFIIILLKCICFQHIRSRHTFIPWLCWEKPPIHRSDIAPFLEHCFLVLPYSGTLFLSTKPNRHFPVGSIRSIDEEAYHAPDLSCSSSTSQQFLSFLKINCLFTYAFDMSPCLGSSWIKESLSVPRFVYFVFHIPDIFNTTVPFFFPFVTLESLVNITFWKIPPSHFGIQWSAVQSIYTTTNNSVPVIDKVPTPPIRHLVFPLNYLSRSMKGTLLIPTVQ